MKAASRGHDDISIFVECQASPQSLLHGFAAAGCPKYLFHATSANFRSHVRQQTFIGADLKTVHRIVGRERSGWSVLLALVQI